MPSITLDHHHVIKVRIDRLFGGIVASYDGKRVCRRRTITDPDVTLSFRAIEDGQEVDYEVDTTRTPLVPGTLRIAEVRRNGEVIPTG